MRFDKYSKMLHFQTQNWLQMLPFSLLVQVESMKFYYLFLMNNSLIVGIWKKYLSWLRIWNKRGKNLLNTWMKNEEF